MQQQQQQQQKKKNFRKRSSIQEEEVEGEENPVKSDDEQERRYPSLFLSLSPFYFLVVFYFHILSGFPLFFNKSIEWHWRK